jgi:predicted enzyme related to lactoylglutathione lyase
MPVKHGTFAWYELMTSDPKAAADFYGKVIGWHAKDAGVGDRPYTLLCMGETTVGGLMAIPESARAQGAPPCWTGYVVVDDVDACAGRVKAAGGRVIHPPEDVPGVLRFCVVADPQGAPFIIFRGTMDEPPGPGLAPDAPGKFGWHELHANDGASAFDFYAKLFGWTKADAVDMGAQGVYQLFATGGAPVGGVMTRMPDTPSPFWLFYVNVEAIDAAVARVAEGGGRVAMGPHQVPGGSWIAVGTDPQGAWFAMVAPKR